MGFFFVGTVEEAIEGLRMCTVPPSCPFVGRTLLVYNYSSIRLGSSIFFVGTLEWVCSDSYAQLQGYEKLVRSCIGHKYL